MRLPVTKIAAFAALTACAAPPSGGSADDTGRAPADTGAPSGSLVVTGRLATRVARDEPVPGPGYDCPDDASGGVSGHATPSVFALSIRRITLLGAEGTDDFVIASSENPDEAEEVDVASEDAALASAAMPPAGTYDGLELQVWSARTDFELVVPAVSEAPLGVPVHGWFADVDPLQKRDLTFTIHGGDYWVDRESWELAPTYGDRPDNVLDLWDDPDFWAAEPVTLSTRDPAGSDLRFEVADGGELVVPEDASGTWTIALEFDVTDRLTWWESDPDAPDGVFTVGEDCGFRLLFPAITAWMEGG